MRKLLAACLVAAGLFASASDAAVRRLCEVSYETQRGWSDPVVVEVYFATGQELNDSSGTIDFGYFDNYALIWFANDQVAVLKITDLMIGVGRSFTGTDFVNQFQFLSEKDAVQTNAPAERRWRIQAKNLGRWIDPRAAQPRF